MNNYKIIWSPSANKELNNIYNYIAYYFKGISTAKTTIKKIIGSVSDLAIFPEKYSKIFYYKNKHKNIRKLLIDNYVVIYEVDNIFRESLHFTHISFKSKLLKSIIKSQTIYKIFYNSSDLQFLNKYFLILFLFLILDFVSN